MFRFRREVGLVGGFAFLGVGFVGRIFLFFKYVVRLFLFMGIYFFGYINVNVFF